MARRSFSPAHRSSNARDHALYLSRGVEFVREPKVMDYGTVAVFRDLYGNLWDLVQFADGHPLAVG